MQDTPLTIVGIVRRDDYDHLRRLIPALPEDFPLWIQRRLFERRAFEQKTGRLAAVEQVDPVDFGRYCSRESIAPTERALDAWATKIHIVQ